MQFQEILEDDNILKVGVAPKGDADLLAVDYGVCVASTLDLRYLAAMTNCRPGGLGKMSEEYINVKLDKNWRIRCSDWEAQILTQKQIQYAANDAHVSIELFKVFAYKLRPKKMTEKLSTYVRSIIDDYCFSYMDANYIGLRVVSKDGQKSNNSGRA